jgi:anti-sigma factor RsiW
VVAWLHAQTRGPDDSARREIVSAHVRGLAQDQFRPVESGDPHVVRPWFAGKLAFAPRVVDLAETGFPLQGGRVDRFLDQPAAALVYLRRNHRITLFIVPTGSRERPDDPSGQPAGERGYHLIGWHDSEFTYWAVSDLNRAELVTFAERVRAEIARAAARPPR